VAAEHLDAGAAGPAAQDVPPQLVLTGGDKVGAHRLLEGEDQAGPDGLDDDGGAALLARDRVVLTGLVNAAAGLVAGRPARLGPRAAGGLAGPESCPGPPGQGSWT